MTTKIKLKLGQAWYIHTVTQHFTSNWDDYYISYGDTLDQAVELLNLDSKAKLISLTGRRLPALDNLELVRNNPKSIYIKLNGKDHCLAKYKDSNNICLSQYQVLSNGKKFFQFSSIDIAGDLNISYSIRDGLINELYSLIKRLA